MKQKALGLLLVLISVAIVVLASRGATPEDRNCTVVLFLLPLGLQLIFSRENYLHTEGDGDEH